jgi:hypothetical protein
MPWYGHTRERYSYCLQPSGWLCDFRDEQGEPCRLPLCSRHQLTDGSEDRCWEHGPAVEHGDLSGKDAAERTGGSAPVIEPRCAATTQRGTPCKGIVPNGRSYCLVHDPELADKVQAARRRGGTVSMKLKLLQGRRQRLDSPKKLLAFCSDLALDTLSGSIQPDVSRAVAGALSLQVKLLEMHDLEARMQALEATTQQKGNRRHGVR